MQSLEVQLIKIKDVRSFGKERYTKAYQDRTLGTAEGNPISRNHPTIPYASDLIKMESALKTERGKAQPSVPSSGWVNNVLIQRAAHCRVMRGTSYVYRSIIKDWARENWTLTTAMLYEYYLVSEYRPPLLKSRGGFIRHRLYYALKEHLTGDMIQIENGIRYMWYLDGFYFPPVEEVSGAVDPKAQLIGIQQQLEYTKELDSFFKRFKGLKSAQLSSIRLHQDEGVVFESESTRHLNALMRVSFSFTCIHTVY